jgi:serine phosphatase RsbU (regulator of sigma subunit)
MNMGEWFHKAERFVRSRAKDFDGGEFQRLFDRDAARAYGVVTRDHAREEEPESRVGRLFYRVRILFMGLAYKLTPPRRLVFAICMVLAAWGLVDLDLNSAPSLQIGLLSLLSIAGLVFLLVLELADRVVVRDELEVARELQREILPVEAPDIEGYSFAFSYRTANTIGGDYYDFFPLEDGRLAVITGDASGHGIAAGLLMAIAGSALKLGFDADPDPVAVTRVVNRALCRTGGTRAFMTLFCGVLEPESGRLRFVCAGHPFPLLRRADGEILELGVGCLPLGIRLELEFEALEVEIEPGDCLVLYTDGVVETLSPSGESFGFERLPAAVASGGTSQAVHDRVLSQVEAFRQGEPVLDDLSLVVITRA